MAAMMLMIGASAVTGQEGSEEIVWEGHGSEHVGECTEGYHWVLTTGGSVLENVELHTNESTVAMVQQGPAGTPSSWHAFTGIVETESGVTPRATFDVVSEGNGEMVLTISDCAEEPGPSPSPSPTPTEPPVPPTACPPVDLRAVAHNNVTISVMWDHPEGFDEVHLYRAIAGTEDFDQIGSFGPNTTAYHDSDVALDVTYEYMLALDIEGNETECERVEVTAIPFFTTATALGAATALSALGYVLVRRRK